MNREETNKNGQITEKEKYENLQRYSKILWERAASRCGNDSEMATALTHLYYSFPNTEAKMCIFMTFSAWAEEYEKNKDKDSYMKEPKFDTGGRRIK